MAVVNLNVNQITGTSSKHGTSFRSGQGPDFFTGGSFRLKFYPQLFAIFGLWPWVVVHTDCVISNAVRNSGVGIDTITLSSVHCAECGGRGEEWAEDTTLGEVRGQRLQLTLFLFLLPPELVISVWRWWCWWCRDLSVHCSGLHCFISLTPIFLWKDFIKRNVNDYHKKTGERSSIQRCSWIATYISKSSHDNSVYPAILEFMNCQNFLKYVSI